MSNRGWLSAPFLAFSRLEQIGELFDGENALLFMLPHDSCCDSVEQAEVILLFGLGVARALKGAERTMLIQNDGRGLRRGNCCPCLEGFKERHEVFGTLFQFDGMRCTGHPNDASSDRQLVLYALQNIPGKGQLNLLLFAYAIGTHADRGFVTVFASSRLPLYSGQDGTLRFTSVHLEPCIDQHLAPITEVLHRV